MINFRYHVIAIAAVFLAMVVGLGVGTAALSGPVAGDVSGRGPQQRQTNDQLRQEVSEKGRQAAGQDAFVRDVAPSLLAKKLTGRKVLVVTMPGADTSVATGIQRLLPMAGATATGTLSLTDSFVDPTRNDELVDLSQRLLPVSVRGLPNASNGADTAAALLARSFIAGQAPVTDAERASVAAGFGQLKMLAGTSPTGAADAVVVVTGAPLTGQDAAKKNAGVLSALKQFDTAAAPTVAAGTTATGAGNAITTVRTTPALAAAVSTVDNANTAQGQVGAALALADQLTRKVGHYGFGTGATAALPPVSGTAGAPTNPGAAATPTQPSAEPTPTGQPAIR